MRAGQSFGQNVWAMRNAQAFLSAGKRGLSGGECTSFSKRTTEYPCTGGLWVLRSTAEKDSLYTAEGLRGSGAPRGGSGVRSEPEAEAAVRDLSTSGRRSTWIDVCRRGDKRSFEGVTVEDSVGS